MSQYTFVTKTHAFGGNEKATVDILSRRDVERIADAVAGNAVQSMEERLSRHIEGTGRTALEAKDGANEARMDAKAALEEARSTAERLAGSARDTFRGIVAESLMPVLESGLGQVLDKQEEIQRDHKVLQDANAGFRLELAAAGERDDVLDRKISDLRAALEALRTDVAAAGETAERRWAESVSANKRFLNELTSLRMGAEASRQEAEKRFAAIDAEKLRVQGKLDAVNDRLNSGFDALHEEVAGARQAVDGKLAELAGENLRLREEIETLRTEADAASRETAERLSGMEAGIRTLSAATGQAGWAKECQVLRADMARLRRRFTWAVALLLAGMLGLGGVLWGREGGKPAEMATDGMEGTATSVERSDAGEYAENEGGEIPPERVEPPVAGGDEEEIAALLGRARAGEKEAEIRAGRLILDGRRVEATDKEAVRWVLSAGLNGAEGAGTWLSAQAHHGGNRAAQAFLLKARQGDARTKAILKTIGIEDCGEPQETEPGGENRP